MKSQQELRIVEKAASSSEDESRPSIDVCNLP